MKVRLPKKSQRSKPDPVVIKIDPTLYNVGLLLPEIKYEIQAVVDHKEVFNGAIIPFPKVLFFFLTHNEMLIVATILEETRKNGTCSLTVTEMGHKLRISAPTLCNGLYKLRKLGLLLETPNGKKGSGRTRSLNYETLQHLNDLVEDEDYSVIARLRSNLKKKSITSFTKDDIKDAYDNHALPVDHDPEEEEEYN